MYRYLAVDFGDSHVGLAVSNGLLARPMKVFDYQCCDYKRLREHLLRIIATIKPEVIVVGVPSKKDSREKIQRIFLTLIFTTEELAKKVVWANEDYSTKEALLLKKRRTGREDSIAAVVILENYFTKYFQPEG